MNVNSCFQAGQSLPDKGAAILSMVGSHGLSFLGGLGGSLDSH